MKASRDEFASRAGFVMAAAGSAVGLGNIWGFPTETASHGGGAFLVVYLILAFALAYPALMAELIIGRYAKANSVVALRSVSTHRFTKKLGVLIGLAGIVTASLILCFYSILSGWMMAHLFVPLAKFAGAQSLSAWLGQNSGVRSAIFTSLFMLLTIFIISAGVKNGIEKWSSRLMPVLLVILVLLIVYVLCLPGATEGLRVYLFPDFGKVMDPKLILYALGQAFFSLSLGVGTMLIYGSYISKKENIVALGWIVTLVDVGIAVMAGLLILPAMYVAQNNGVQIFDAGGQLIQKENLIFVVLPKLFDTMGVIGIFVTMAFFLLMVVAAVTSSISMLEVPVAYGVENLKMTRKSATYLMGSMIAGLSIVIALNFEALFGLVAVATTKYSQPLLGLMLCVFAGWIWNRNQMLSEIKQGFSRAEKSLFWKIWPTYVRYVCPLVISAVFIQMILS
jgi:NSS family neurotransmitter:Na+ symporter